jgi:OPA family glycerol-3-phosphate transporter-like MFS transporter
MTTISTIGGIPPVTAPKLGRVRKRMLLATMLCYLCFYTGRQNFGFFAKSMQEDLQLSATAVGSISAALLLAYGIGQSINGALADRYRPGNLVALGALLSVALNWVTSFGTTYGSIIVPWAANGYAQSFGWAPSCRLTSGWSRPEERGRAFGLLLVSAACSSILTFALCILVLRYFSWHWALRLPPLTLAAASIFFWYTTRHRPPDGSTIAGEGAETARERYRHVLRNRSFQLASLSLGCESIARYGLIYWVPMHFLGANWREDALGSAMTTLGLPIGMALGAFLAGYLTDRLFPGNPSTLIALMLILAAAVCGLLAVVPRTEVVAGFVLLLAAGFLVYGPQAGYWALCPALAGQQRVGTAVGVMNACAYGFASAGEVLIGYVVDRTGTTTSLFHVVLTASLAGAALALLSSRTRGTDQIGVIPHGMMPVRATVVSSRTNDGSEAVE